MTEWDPATEAEAAMRDALRVSDQELYFRILARTELFLPVSADALAGRAPMGWGTWNSGGRTHVLAFTSTEAMRICLAEHAGSARRIVYHELAAAWPNHEWWLAVNPGLPIEGYLPPWFVGQLARGDVRLPGRSMAGRARAEHATASSRSGSAAGTSPRTGRSGAAPEPDFLDDPNPTRPLRTPGRTRTAPPSSAATAGGATMSAAGAAAAGAAAGRAAAASAAAAGSAAGATTTGPESRRPADPNRRTGPGRAEAGRRPRRHESSIIDAEIIESTVLGATALEATIVDATVIDASLIDSDVIDVSAVDTSIDAITAGTPRPAGNTASATSTPADPTTPAKATPAFVPANEVEENLLIAATSGKTDNFLSTLLLAKVIIPIPTGESPDSNPDNPAFPWRREVVDGQAYLVCFTSPERLTEFMGAGVVTVTAKFMQLIRVWPDIDWAFAVNPGSPVGATLPGAQIKALSVWAADVGLTEDDPEVFDEGPVPTPPPSTSTIIMQKPIAPSQVDYYLERGYDRVSGFVHRATEVARLETPEKLYSALGLSYTGSPFERAAEEIYVLRWAAHRGDLYRIPYGGQHEAAMRAMQGWIIERAPFRGNGFAPAERNEIIAEFKVDSIRLPHGAQMWRLTATGDHVLVAILDADDCLWRSAREVGVVGVWDPTVVPPSVPDPTPEPESRAAQAARRPRSPDPADDPLDPRWRGHQGSAGWSATRAGER